MSNFNTSDYDKENEAEEALDPQDLLACLFAVTSIWGQMVQTEGKVLEEDLECFVVSLGVLLGLSDENEEDLIIYDLNLDRLRQLEEIGVNKEKLREVLIEFLNQPLNLRKIIRIAEDLELEEEFFFEACKFIAYKNSGSQVKLDFLNQFGEKLGLSEFDKNSIKKRAILFFEVLNEITESRE